MILSKDLQYAALISAQIQEMFDAGSANHINVEDFDDSEKFKMFLHALSTLVPGMMYNSLTGENKNNLEYNHIANQLCFEYSTREGE